MKHEKVSGELGDVTVCAAIEVSRVPSGIPRDPRSRVTSRVVIRDHRSPIRRNKTRQTCTLKRGAAFSCLSWSGIPFVPLHLGHLEWVVVVVVADSLLSPTWPSFSFILPSWITNSQVPSTLHDWRSLSKTR